MKVFHPKNKVMLETTTINHRARRDAGLSNDEYCLIDLIDRLSNNPPKYTYCTLSKEAMANDLGITRQGLLKMIARLCDKGYIEDAGKGRLRSTNAWFEIVNKVYIDCKQSLQPVVNKVYNESKQSLHNNYKQENIQENTYSENAFQNAVKANREALKAEPAKVAPPFDSTEFASLWQLWGEYLSSKGKPASRITLELHAKILRQYPEKLACEMLNKSIANGWSAVYPPEAKHQDSKILKTTTDKPKLPTRK